MQFRYEILEVHVVDTRVAADDYSRILRRTWPHDVQVSMTRRRVRAYRTRFEVFIVTAYRKLPNPKGERFREARVLIPRESDDEPRDYDEADRMAAASERYANHLRER